MLKLYSAENDFHSHYLARLAAEARAGYAEALHRFAAYGPYAGMSGSEIQVAAPTMIDAFETGAAEHGFGTWREFELYLEAVRERREKAPSMRLFRAVENDDLDKVRTSLDDDASLANAVASTGKSALQKSPSRAMAELLLARGADPAREATVPGSTGILHAVLWGFTDVVDAIGEHSRAPGNLRVAAALGDLAMIDTAFDADGTLTPAARAVRDYYRPNYGWYPWSPSDSAQEVLDEALILAATHNRIDAMDALRSRGASVDGKVFDTTAMIRAAWKGHLPAVQSLIEAGADLDVRGRHGGHAQGVTALHIAAESNHQQIVDVLLNAGANPTLEDDLPPAGWARNRGHTALAERLQTLA